MALRDRLRSSPETLQDFEIAANEKYWEAMELMLAGQKAAGIYLMGYVAEMRLKLAYFRIIGERLTTEVRPLLGPVRTEAGQLGLDPENYHSLRLWSELLIKRRTALGKTSASGELEKTLRGVANTLYDLWWVEMRYRPDSATEDEMNLVFDGVSWLDRNYMSLWR